MIRIILVFFCLLFSSEIFASTNSNLTYTFTVPYQGAGEIVVSNHSAQSITVTTIEFDVNANFNMANGNLWSYTAALTQKQNADGITYHYTLAEGNVPVTIPANSQANLTYNYSTQQGPLPIGMIISHLKINGTTLPLDGMCQGTTCNDPTPGMRIMGYYSDWDRYQINYFPNQIPMDKANTIGYSFLNYDTSGNVILYDPYSDSAEIPAIATLRQQYPYLNASLTWGGWTLSTNFSDLVNNPSARAQFVTNAVNAMKEAGFNGVDIDWEYPVFGTYNKNTNKIDPGKPVDATNYAALLTELRAALDAAGQKDGVKYYLTIAAPAGIDKIQDIQNADPNAWNAVMKAVDYVDVMTYDFHGGWDLNSAADFMSAMQLDPQNDPTAKDPVTGQYDVNDAIAAYLKLGFKPSQIIVGIPVYGRLSNVTQMGDKNGLYQIVAGTPKGEYDQGGDIPSGMFDYKCIMDSSTCKNNSAPLLSGLQIIKVGKSAYNQYSHTPWGYIASQNQFLTFDDADSTAFKANWVKANHLAGVMFWEFSGDLDENNPQSLVNVAYQALKTNAKKR